MFFNTATTSIALLAAVGLVSSTTPSNLRGRTAPLSQNRGRVAAKRHLRSRSASADIGSGDASVAEEASIAVINAVEDVPVVVVNAVEVEEKMDANPKLEAHRPSKYSTMMTPPKKYRAGAKRVALTASADDAQLAGGGGVASSERKMQDTTPGPAGASITSSKAEYEDAESITLHFTLPAGLLTSSYEVGIFMRMANPQGGALRPLVHLPLCPEQGCSSSAPGGDITGSVTFSYESMMTGTMPAVTHELDKLERDDEEGGGEEMVDVHDETVAAAHNMWPIDLYKWGTGFDAYVLDETGDDVVGPVMFNIKMDDTY